MVFQLCNNKKDVLETSFKNGASNGRELENNCIRLAQLSLHESELITNIKQIICLC